MREVLDIEYGRAGGQALLLDLFLPDGAENPPLILWIHGGAWLAGDRKSPLMKWQVARGYALASVEYRLSGQALFPAQIVDCKSALWWLRQNAADYGYDPARVIVAGDSAGGHLAALMGASAGQADWEPPGADCTVQAVVDYYGPVDVTHAWPNAARIDSPEAQLIGERTLTARGRALWAAANPLTYIDGAAPPYLILHGDADDTVPFGQSVLLRDALEAAGASVALHRVYGGGHGFDSSAANAAVDAFLDHHFKG